MKSNKFWKIFFLFSVSLAAAIFTTLHGKLDKITIAFISPRFWLAVSFSFALCSLLILYIYYISKWLDRSIDWKISTAKRSLYQLLLGVIIPSIGDLIVMAIYYNLLDTDIFASGFMMSEYHGIILFIMVINLCLIVQYLWENVSDVDEADDSEPITLTIHNSKIHVELTADDILYFCRINRKVTVVTINGLEYFTNLSLSKLLYDFQPAGYLQINRSVIINPSIVKGYRKVDGRVVIIINGQYEKSILHKQNDLFTVTSDHVLELKDRFGLPIET